MSYKRPQINIFSGAVWGQLTLSPRLRVVPPFFLRDSRASGTRARVKITPIVSVTYENERISVKNSLP